MNTIEGKYPLRPDLPGVPGHEGMGVVEAVGPKVRGAIPREFDVERRALPQLGGRIQGCGQFDATVHGARY